MVIVLDAINQLLPKYHNLKWLSSNIPPNVRIVVTTIAFGDHISLLGKSMYFSLSLLSLSLILLTIRFKIDITKHFEVQPMQGEPKRKVVLKKLQTFGKTLAPVDIVINSTFLKIFIPTVFNRIACAPTHAVLILYSSIQCWENFALLDITMHLRINSIHSWRAMIWNHCSVLWLHGGR